MVYIWLSISSVLFSPEAFCTHCLFSPPRTLLPSTFGGWLCLIFQALSQCLLLQVTCLSLGSEASQATTPSPPPVSALFPRPLLCCLYNDPPSRLCLLQCHLSSHQNVTSPSTRPLTTILGVRMKREREEKQHTLYPTSPETLRRLQLVKELEIQEMP